MKVMHLKNTMNKRHDAILHSIVKYPMLLMHR